MGINAVQKLFSKSQSIPRNMTNEYSVASSCTLDTLIYFAGSEATEARGTMWRVVMMLDEARRILKEYHGSGMGGHFGSAKSTTSITHDFKWKIMTNQIKHWVSKTLPGYT